MYLYRGDDRAPADVFKTGFVSRVCNREYWNEVASAPFIDTTFWAKPIVRPCPHYDFDTSFSLCFTANPLLAALFPLTRVKETYIYLVDESQLGTDSIELAKEHCKEMDKIEKELATGWDEALPRFSPRLSELVKKHTYYEEQAKKAPQDPNKKKLAENWKRLRDVEFDKNKTWTPPMREAYLEAAVKRNEVCLEYATKLLRGHSVAAAVPIYRDVPPVEGANSSVTFRPGRLEPNPHYCGAAYDISQLPKELRSNDSAQDTYSKESRKFTINLELPSNVVPKKHLNPRQAHQSTKKTGTVPKWL
jgi:hypothetical protein